MVRSRTRGASNSQSHFFGCLCNCNTPRQQAGVESMPAAETFLGLQLCIWNVSAQHCEYSPEQIQNKAQGHITGSSVSRQNCVTIELIRLCVYESLSRVC